jgi:hypothetical protein
VEHLESSMAVAREIGDRNGRADSLQVLGNVYVALGDHDRAIALHAEALGAHREIGSRLGIAYDVEAMARAAGSVGDVERALRLAGASDTLREQLKVPRTALEQRALESVLGEQGEAAELLRAEGRAMALEEAIAIALGGCRSHE